MDIDTLEAVEVGGITQWIRMRGRNASNPVLLLMQQGPGLPMINEARSWGRTLGLGQDFTVVYWDQRGTGLSSRTPRTYADDAVVGAAQMVDDTVSMLELLCHRFNRKTFVAGFSFGATFAARAAVRRPDLVAALVATGMDIDIPFAENHTYDFVLRTAHQRANRRAVRQLEGIGPPPHLDVTQFSTRARWAANFGGVTANATFNGLLRALLASLFRSPDYSVADVIRAVRGIAATQAALLPQLAGTDLVDSIPPTRRPHRDGTRPPRPGRARGARTAVLRSRDSTQQGARLVEKSAHTPQYDEPAKFRSLLMTVRSSHLANT
jgi:pimeloyl-ACP methyl ester carboxylesterase